jgi:uncharacterized protein (DUF169 family)
MVASYDESPDINKQKDREKQEKHRHCFVEKQSRKQRKTLVADSGLGICIIVIMGISNPSIFSDIAQRV